MIGLRTLGVEFTRLAWHGVRTFVVTFVGVFLYGCVLAALSYWFLQSVSQWAGLGALLAIVEGIALATILARQRGMLAAMTEGLRRMGIGRETVSTVFKEAEGEQPALAVQQSQPSASTSLVQTAALQMAIGRLSSQMRGGTWLRRLLWARVLGLLGTWILSRSRHAEAQRSGASLMQLRQELESSADEMLTGIIRLRAQLWTWGAIVGFPIVVALQTFAISMMSAWRL
ncbi:MAG: hypothetical protein K2X38_05000 [Gemmataceae bacterium]|nr:hypothetical protein [Gemmataceae bacterium]